MNCTSYAPQLEPVHEGKQPKGVEHPVVHFRGTRKLCRADQIRPEPTSKSRCVADRRREARNCPLTAVERRLLSIRDELVGRAWQLGKVLPAIKGPGGTRQKWMVWLPDGNSGRRAGLRIAKSSISGRRFFISKRRRFTKGKQVFV